MLIHARLCGKVATVKEFQRSLDYINHRKTAKAIDRLCVQIAKPFTEPSSLIDIEDAIDIQAGDRFFVDLGMLWQFRGDQMRYIENGDSSCWRPEKYRTSKSKVSKAAAVAWIEHMGGKVIFTKAK